MKNKFDDIKDIIGSYASGSSINKTDKEAKYLSQLAPNVIQWVTGKEYLNMPSTFGFWRQYQIMRDLYNLRCKVCNSQDPDEIECWGKSKDYLESEILFEYSDEYSDFVCPKCRSTQKEHMVDGIIGNSYEELVCLAGMRSGKSYLGAFLGTYIDHVTAAFGSRGKQYLQHMLKQAKSEWFDLSFAAGSERQTAGTVWSKFKEMRNDSPWMQRYLKWLLEKEKNQPNTALGKWSYKNNELGIYDGWRQVRIEALHSSSGSLAGRTRVGVIYDEICRGLDTEGNRSVREIYRVLNNSLRTVRSSVDHNNIFRYLGLMASVSSPFSLTDLGYEMYIKAIKGESKRSYGCKYSTWEFNPFIKEEDFESEKVRDYIGYRRDFLAEPPAAANPWILHPYKFWKSSINWDKKPLATFNVADRTDRVGKDYLSAQLEFCNLDVSGNNYYIFMDAGVSFDSFSLVIGHPAWIDADAGIFTKPYEPENEVHNNMPVNNLGGNHISQNSRHISDLGGSFVGNSPFSEYQVGTFHANKVLAVSIDAALRIVPTDNKDVWFDSILDIIKDLKKRIKIAAVSSDSWQSVSTHQSIRDLGIPCYSTTLKMNHFSSFRNAAYSGLIDMLPPNKQDIINVSEDDIIEVGTPQEHMAAESVAFLEFFKLEEEASGKRIIAPNKGKKAGCDSDDVARCYIGLYSMIQEALADSGGHDRKQKIKGRLMNNLASFEPKVI